MTSARVARLQVRGSHGDPLTTRLGVERVLGAIDLQPSSLPPSAILCVRELRDPRPGTISLDTWQLRPPPAWEQAMRAEVDRLARAATRPARGAVPAAADAVVFADEADLLACLGCDLLAGVTGARWWWRLLVGGIEQPRRATVRAWAQAPAHAPAALQAMAERGLAAAFVRVLDDREAGALADAITRHFALPAMAPVGAARLSPFASTPAAPTRVAPAPWTAVAPEAVQPALSTEQRVLIGVALTLARAPLLARSTDFAIALAAWRVAAAALDQPAAPTELAHEVPVAPANLPDARAQPRPQGSTAMPRSPGPVDAAMRANSAGEPSADVDIRSPVLATPIDGAAPTPVPRDPPLVMLAPAALSPPTPPLAAPAAPDADFASHPGEVVAPTAVVPIAPEAQETPRRSAPHQLHAPRPPSRAFGPPIGTALGGLFYLVNLARYLRLYSDGDNLALPLWDFVALIGRELLGDAAIADDPVWSLLAALAGRAADQPPGADYVPPADWRIPPAWLAPFEPSPAHHQIRHGRLIITYAEGFLLVDVAADTDSDAQLARELAPYRDLPCTPGTDALSPPPAAPLDRWIARLVPYLRARLRSVLGTDDAGLPALLLVHRARVHATETHLDIMLSLDTLPVEIRFAGLDRDPGWVPAAGRFVAFHFE